MKIFWPWVTESSAVTVITSGVICTAGLSYGSLQSEEALLFQGGQRDTGKTKPELGSHLLY